MLQKTKIEGETLLDLSRIKWKQNAVKVVSARGSSGGLAGGNVSAGKLF